MGREGRGIVKLKTAHFSFFSHARCTRRAGIKGAGRKKRRNRRRRMRRREKIPLLRA
jgi:hypothetical protein